MELTTEEVAMVFAMYYHADCITTEYPQKGKVRHIGFIPINAGYYKILLTPLPEITDEHAIEVMKMEYPHVLNGFEVLKIDRNGKGRISINFRWKHQDKRRNLDDGYCYSSWASNFCTISKEEFQYYISKGYAVPLWFGIDHWANGKTAIELGIAISN